MKIEASFALQFPSFDDVYNNSGRKDFFIAN